MKRDRTIYWISTGLIAAVMTYSVISFTFFEYGLYPDGSFHHLGLPPYIKVELTIAKILGIAALLIPVIPALLKEFAYAGFTITLISASIAHAASGDSFLYIIDPLIFLGILFISYRYYNKLRKERLSSEESS